MQGSRIPSAIVSLLAGACVLGLVAAGSSRAAGPPGGLDVHVVNKAGDPVPVTGAVSAEVTGAVQAEQSGAWNVGASQNGTWNVGASQNGTWNVGIVGTPTVEIDSSSAVSVAPRATQTLLEVPFDFVGDGETLELGPIDVSENSTVRVATRAVNGEVEFRILSNVADDQFFVLDSFRIGSEGGGNEYQTAVFEVPGTSLSIEVTEVGGPGGSNYGVTVWGN